ncbi:hypothetical protein CXB51_017764 [Gossypium anomalum]|uniref:DUF538 domain-containing protein n=1 Tax=Gossypium anomalum TaxID=47600 RepID=A0A8J5YNR2_9ROSI|nr:hypothetical protein CXB51_017764 [Gossypium anomalum]
MIPLVPSIFLHVIFIFFALVNGEQETIYDILKAHGLPTGLLPKGITRFVYDETGRFEVQLDQACNAMFECQFRYDRNVSGTLKYGQIGALSGISSQELFLWFQVKGIWVDVPSSGLIYFDVGVVSKQFSLSWFETPRDCMAIQDDSESGDSIGDGKVHERNIDMNLIMEVLGGTRSRKLERRKKLFNSSISLVPKKKKVDFTFSPLLFSLALGGLLKPCSISELLGIYLMCGKAICLFSGHAMK